MKEYNIKLVHTVEQTYKFKLKSDKDFIEIKKMFEDSPFDYIPDECQEPIDEQGLDVSIEINGIK